MKKFPLLGLLVFVSCIAPRVTITNSNATNDLVIDGKIFATSYQQRSAEYKALCYQAFNIAHERIEQIIDQRSGKPLAIMTDIDETVLNNSPYEVHQLLQNKDYDQASWKEWTAKGQADTIPGALHFLQYAAQSGIEIFYVTNRGEDEREGTLSNLKKFNFPDADDQHLLLMKNTSLQNYSLGAWLKDVLLGLKYFAKWNKLGIVTDKQKIKRFTDFFGTFLPSVTKGFMMEDEEIAKRWIAE